MVGQGSGCVATRVSVTHMVLLAAEMGWCCVGEETPPARVLRWLLSPGMGMLGPRGQDGPAPGSQLLRSRWHAWTSPPVGCHCVEATGPRACGQQEASS